MTPSSRPWLLAVVAAAAGCASTLKVNSEYDPKAQFGDYKTYAWNPTPAGPDQAPAARDPAVRAMVVAAVDRELARKGLVKVSVDAEPSFIVTALGTSQRKVEVTNYGYAYAPSYVYGPYGPGYALASPGAEVRDYQVGTLLLDFSDARTKQLFWRGVATDAIQDPREVRATIDGAVKKLLEDYPPRAKK